MIADLEHALGVRLLDRGAQGVAPTIYGGALLKRTVVVFDELKQSIRDIEFLSDATTGKYGSPARSRLSTRCWPRSFYDFLNNIRASRCTPI